MYPYCTESEVGNVTQQQQQQQQQQRPDPFSSCHVKFVMSNMNTAD